MENRCRRDSACRRCHIGRDVASGLQAEPAAATKDFTKPAIVILGYGLNPDGTMRTILRRRVMTGLTVAQFFPQSPIIVTGGNAASHGNTEAGQMRKMLMLLGFPDNRIMVEDKANSTVQNARFSVPLAKQARTSGIILVTSTTIRAGPTETSPTWRQHSGDGELPRREPVGERRPVRAGRDRPIRQRRLAALVVTCRRVPLRRRHIRTSSVGEQNGEERSPRRGVPPRDN